MKNKNNNFLIALAVIFVLGGFLFVYRAGQQGKSIDKGVVQEEVTAPTTKTYTNNKYSFSFDYPAEYGVLEYSQSRISIGEHTNSGFKSVVDVDIFESESSSEQSFEEFVLDQARLSCSSGNLLCLEVDELRPFFSTSQDEGQKFFLLAEDESLKTTVLGPYYTFNLSSKTPGRMSFLMISNPKSVTSEVADTKALDSVALSLKI